MKLATGLVAFQHERIVVLRHHVQIRHGIMQRFILVSRRCVEGVEIVEADGMPSIRGASERWGNSIAQNQKPRMPGSRAFHSM